MWKATRRFRARLSALVFGTNGRDSPYPIVVIRPAPIPSLTNASLTAIARAALSTWLTLASPL